MNRQKFHHKKNLTNQLNQQIQDFEIKSEPITPNGRKHKPSKTSKEPQLPLSMMDHLNINCRFVIKTTSTLNPTTLNVNKPINFKDVWRISCSSQKCPICLETACVPRMLNCGHIMCFNCMIDHRNFSENPNVCPICGDIVSPFLNHTMAVSFLDCDELFKPKENEELVLTLMKRQINSCVSLPVNLDLDDLLITDEFPNPDYLLYTRVCTADVEWAKAQLANDLKILIREARVSKLEYKDDLGFLDAAEEMKRYLKTLKEEVKPSRKAKKLKPEFCFYYGTFFESSTIYTLNTLDVHILNKAFNTTTKLPSSLIVKLENVVSTNLEHKPKFKQLDHIPEHTTINFMECDFTDVVSKDVLTSFDQKLKNRRVRKCKELAKDAEERKAAEENVENQFKCEVAEALLPHSNIGPSKHRYIDPSTLPSLPSINNNNKDTKPRPVQPPKWDVDPNAEFSELMKQATMTKRGKKKKEMVIRL